jgi:hypothetical protein
MKITPVLIFSLFLATACAAQQKPRDEAIHAMCPVMHPFDSELNARGEKGMGFSQSATTHHFLLTSDGGIIQVEVNDPSNAADLAKIRMHLHHIANAFQAGDFDIPMFVHDTVPPGEPELKQLNAKIRYEIHEATAGGRVQISSSDKNAIIAIHKFLIFQIQEHQTGDPIQFP